MCDYYANKPESKCGPWVDLEHFVIIVRKPLPIRKGDTLSEEERRSISDGKKRRKQSVAAKKKISRSLKRKRKSKAHRDKISRALRGQPKSEVTKARMSEASSTKNLIVGTILGLRSRR